MAWLCDIFPQDTLSHAIPTSQVIHGIKQYRKKPFITGDLTCGSSIHVAFSPGIPVFLRREFPPFFRCDPLGGPPGLLRLVHP